MKLHRTGAFVRAARATHASIHHHHRHFLSAASRWSSTQAQAQTSPDQSVEQPTEVDPEKTAAQSLPSSSPDFKERLKLLDQGNKIIHNSEGQRSGALILGQSYTFDHTTNLPQSILDLVGRNLYNEPDHPLCITRRLIESCFPSPDFEHRVVSGPVVTVQDNFDTLGFPQDHPGRSRTDTYYVNSSHLLRTHTSAHQHAAFQALADGNITRGYTICADVYRRDSIDKSHFPIFHQMEGARVWGPAYSPEKTRYERQLDRTQTIHDDLARLRVPNIEVEDPTLTETSKDNPIQLEHDRGEIKLVIRHLKRSLENLVQTIFEAANAASTDKGATQSKVKARWVEAYFPFTSPSFELEVLWNDTWLELLGSGIVQQPILDKAGLREHVAWAWGLGIERFAMLLFGIPDIRLFWSSDPRFLKQFTRGNITKFQPFSKYPACYKDIAFWIQPSAAAGGPINTNPASSAGVAAAAGGDATKASPAETQPSAFHENDIMEVVRDVAGDLVEDVTLVDEFVHPTSGRKSLCYRINYRSLERTLQNDEVNALHDEVAKRMVGLHRVELR